jgi:hypothetical protein
MHTVKKLKTFGLQANEEINKAKLIVKDSNWEEPLMKAENHWYLGGQIGFLIDYAGSDLDKFKKYWTAFQKVFDLEFKLDKKEGESEKYLLRRALFTLADDNDYLPWLPWLKWRSVGHEHTFCSFNVSLDTKNKEWRKVFAGLHHWVNREKNKYFKNLLDYLAKGKDYEELKSLSEENIKNILIEKNNAYSEKIKNDFNKQVNNENKIKLLYRYIFITKPQYINYKGYGYEIIENWGDIFLKVTSAKSRVYKKMRRNLYLVYLKDRFKELEKFKINFNYHSFTYNPHYISYSFDYKETDFCINVFWNRIQDSFKYILLLYPSGTSEQNNNLEELIKDLDKNNTIDCPPEFAIDEYKQKGVCWEFEPDTTLENIEKFIKRIIERIK